mmetsp:Transcript_14644/g.40426  ORF Transcript_14644/g.40426 Transcript_14644/m.40426 type:complete len:277 (+) Transcript_14644:124-954(+)
MSAPLQNSTPDPHLKLSALAIMIEGDAALDLHHGQAEAVGHRRRAAIHPAALQRKRIQQHAAIGVLPVAPRQRAAHPVIDASIQQEMALALRRPIHGDDRQFHIVQIAVCHGHGERDRIQRQIQPDVLALLRLCRYRDEGAVAFIIRAALLPQHEEIVIRNLVRQQDARLGHGMIRTRSITAESWIAVPSLLVTAVGRCEALDRCQGPEVQHDALLRCFVGLAWDGRRGRCRKEALFVRLPTTGGAFTQRLVGALHLAQRRDVEEAQYVACDSAFM